MSAASPASSPHRVPEQIDMVYAWVDGTWPGFIDQMRPHSRQPVDLNPERYRDMHQLLRYSLRSVEQFCPWVRNIVLFTMRPQVPPWLRRDHPKVRVVHHDEVMPTGILPTFNCNTIETYIQRIPGITPQFLYLNDDFLFGSKTTLDDFYLPDGRMKLLGTLMGECLPFRIYARKHRIVSLGFVEHTPLVIDGDLLEEAMATCPDDIAYTRRERFRTDAQVRMDYLYRYHLIRRHRHRIAIEPFWRLVRYHRFLKIKNNPRTEQRAFDRLRQLRPKFYTLNDDQRDTPNPAVNAIVHDFLEELYPQPSSFEITA